MTYKRKRGVAQYGKVAASSEVAFASPHRLVQMLMEGALDKVSTAKGYMERKEYEAKGQQIAWAISIVNGLRSALDRDAGGDIANNLDDLYEYISRRLMDANVDNDPTVLDEVSSLLSEIKAAWDALPDSVKRPPYSPQGEVRPVAG